MESLAHISYQTNVNYKTYIESNNSALLESSKRHLLNFLIKDNYFSCDACQTSNAENLYSTATFSLFVITTTCT